MPPLDSKFSRLSPQPHWKVATRMPYAAPTERRLRTIALIATTIERNEASRIRKAKMRTKPKTSGAVFIIAVSQSWSERGVAGDGVVDAFDLADRLRAGPRRAGWRAPPARPRRCRSRRAGCRPSRRCCRGSPRPRSGRSSGRSRAPRRLSSAIAFWTGSARTSSALIATTAGSLPPGKAVVELLHRLDLGDRDVVEPGRGRC